ncbi:MAG TPA: RNA-binding protein [bacterium]|nr:RNA-binding protein [bacterium]
MTVQIYVGNLPFSATEGDLRSAFEKFGAVSSAKIVTDRDTGRAKGFGFVEMADQAAAEKAISSLDGADMGGRNIKVNIARPKK